MNITITRGKPTPEGTPGRLTTDAGFSCDTLELPWENNRRGVSCIVARERGAVLWDSPTLNRKVVRLEDTDGRADCLIHNGNWAGEGAGEVTQVHGCTEVGRGYGDIQRRDGITQWGILSSGVTLDALVEHVIQQVGEGGHFTVTHEWGEGCAPDDLADMNGGV